MSSPRRVRTIYSVIASPNRLDILRILNTKGPAELLRTQDPRRLQIEEGIRQVRLPSEEIGKADSDIAKPGGTEVCRDESWKVGAKPDEANRRAIDARIRQALRS